MTTEHDVPAPWTLRLVLETAASVVFAECVFGALLWAAVLR